MRAHIAAVLGACMATLIAATTATAQLTPTTATPPTMRTTTTSTAVVPGPTIPIGPTPFRFHTWRTKPSYYKPAYPIVFVSSYRDDSIGNGGNFGTDVLQVGAPQAGQELWILLPNGIPKKLFPIQGVHDSIVDDTLVKQNGRIIGAVSEPSISINGRFVFFSYFANAQDPVGGCCGPGHSNFEGWGIGGHGYAIDLGPILANVNTSPGSLPVRRLTDNPANVTEHAMNPAMAQITGIYPAAVSYTGFTEIQGSYGPKLIFASTRKMLGNSNSRQKKTNKNFNLFTADFDFDAAEPLSNIRQEQYFTTTSAISPARLRTGYSVSYQANTEDDRQWHIQQIVGHKWGPLFGYGVGNELAHLATFCVKTRSSADLPAGDITVVTQYYNLNNQGFGAFFALPMANAGLNVFDDSPTNGVVPAQQGAVKITANVNTDDKDSLVGKFTTPACGGPDELYGAYDPGDANHRNHQYTYHPYIVFTDLEVADPVAQPGAYKKVVKAATSDYAALWPKPVIDWTQRLTGLPEPGQDATQNTPPSPIDASLTDPLGAPYAVLGTSALHHTDVTPVDCRANSGYFDPFIMGDAHVDPLYKNIAMLTKLMNNGPGDIDNQTGSCQAPGMDDVFGIAVYMTSNRISEDQFTASKRGYATHGSGGTSRESKRLLGIFEVGMEGQTDTSFKARVPSNVPLEFHLLDENGVKLADVRSWHSLKARESRTDCGGCHAHRPNQAGLYPWDSSDSSSDAIPVADMIAETRTIEYDATCTPTMTAAGAGGPVRTLPTWSDLSTEFDNQCGTCHAQTSTNTNARNAFDYDASKLTSFTNTGLPDTGNPLKPLFARKYISRYGANASPMFWAAFGGRTDGRDNALPQYQPQSPDFSTCTDGNPQNCGFVYTSSHDNLATCNGSDPDAARWVFELAQWIDNHAPTDVPNKPQQYQADRYHPTLASALVPDGTDCTSTPLSLDIGFWDDTGHIAELAMDINGTNYFTETNPSVLNNGTPYSINLNGIDVQTIAHFQLAFTATDEAGNRQTYQKTMRELIDECVAAL